MRSKSFVWLVITLLSLALLAGSLPCLANGEGTQTEPGDPWQEPPGSDSLDPTPRILGDWMILMAMAFQLAL